MQYRVTIPRFLLNALLLALGVSVLGQHWLSRPTRTSIPQPEAKLQPQESTYLGLPTSHWRDQLKQPSFSHYWPPLDFPLRERPQRDAIPVLQELLADPDPSIREAAVCCLGLQPSPEDPVLPLLIRAVTDLQPQVRLTAMQALSWQGTVAGDAAPVLLTAMRDDDAIIRFQAARSFYVITGQVDVVLPVLIQNLRGNEGCQMNSAYMLGEIGPLAAAAVDALVQRLRDNSAPPESEGPFGMRFNDSEAQRRDIIHRAVLEALGDIGPNAKEAVPAIRSAFKARNGFVRASACVAFWKITGQVNPAVEPMVDLLENGSWYDKRQSATGLGRMGSAAEAAVPALIKALKDADGGVRWDAAIALGCVGPKAREAIPALIELLKKDEDVRADIVTALKAIDATAAPEAGVLAP